VLQDPARKLTPGTPIYLTFSIIAVYVIVLFAAQGTLQRHAREFARRFSNVEMAFGVFVIFLFLAAINGIGTFGLENWKAPALAFFIYCAPVPAVILGYAWLQREEQMYEFFTFYAVITSLALIGTPLEYFNLDWRVLGTVALNEANLRFVPGFQVRLLAGFYRAPDIMGWHAGTLTIIGIAMIIRGRQMQRVWPWVLVTGWGFLNCLISGRRKAIYMVAVFTGAFLFRYFRRLTIKQVAAFALAGAAMFFVTHKLGQDEVGSTYTRSATTSTDEVLARLEGGVAGTIDQFGFMGAGLGTATQGVYHVLTEGTSQPGWQEGGLGKLTMELGVPGLVGVALLGATLLTLMMKISAHPDVPGSSQFLRATLFGIVIANIVEFCVSAQAYSDAVLALLAAFFAGCLFATAALDERLVENQPAPSAALRPRGAAAVA
jgi:hypothetical protein